MKGYIHLYTGNGKGKTTAALGAAIRAVGAGKKVFITQFVKGMHYAELNALQRFPEIELRQFGLGCFIRDKPTKDDIQIARKGISESKIVIENDLVDMVILDEVCIALHYHLFELEELLAILQQKPIPMEIILTGRYAPAQLFEMADLVTEMKEIKHYYNKGIQAREGIEF